MGSFTEYLQVLRQPAIRTDPALLKPTAQWGRQTHTHRAGGQGNRVPTDACRVNAEGRRGLGIAAPWLTGPHLIWSGPREINLSEDGRSRTAGCRCSFQSHSLACRELLLTQEDAMRPRLCSVDEPPGDLALQEPPSPEGIQPNIQRCRGGSEILTCHSDMW